MLNLIIKPAWLIMEFFVQDTIGHEAYGLYAALFSFSFLFISLADFGVNMYITRRFANETSDEKEVFATTFGFKILVCFAYPLLILGAGFLIGYRGTELFYLSILSFVQSLFQLIYFFRSNFQAKQRFTIDAIASVFDRFILLIVVALLFVFHLVNLNLYIYAILTTTLLSFLIFYFFVFLLYGWISPKLKWLRLNQILKQSFPFALIGVLYAINERVDMVMLERLGGENGEKFSGLYAGAYRWLDAFLMYLWTITPVFYARFSRLKDNINGQESLIEFGQVLTFIPMLFVAGVIWFYSEELFFMFHHSTSIEISTMANLLIVLSFHLLFQGAFALFGVWLNASGFESAVVKMVVVTVLINIGMNYFLIPEYGPIAAAWSTLISSFLISVFYIIKILHDKIISFPLVQLLKFFILSLSYILVLYLMQQLEIYWLGSIIFSGLSLLIFTYLMFKKSFLKLWN